jgi:anti-sigma-K factor RskA
MSALDPHPGDEGPEATAGEYVLGVLDGPARAAFAARLAADPALRRAVQAWETRLAPWAEAVAPVAPPATLWPALERSLGETPPARTEGGVVVVLRQRLRYWRFATGASLALAAMLGFLTFLPVTNRAPTPASAPPPMMMASLAPAGAPHAMFVATLVPSRHTLMIAPANADAHPGHAPELWLIPKGGKPVALGMAGFDAPVKLELASDLGGEGRTTLAVSLEPMGGSPTGQPTGPVIASGELRPL